MLLYYRYGMQLLRSAEYDYVASKRAHWEYSLLGYENWSEVTTFPPPVARPVFSFVRDSLDVTLL